MDATVVRSRECTVSPGEVASERGAGPRGPRRDPRAPGLPRTRDDDLDRRPCPRGDGRPGEGRGRRHGHPVPGGAAAIPRLALGSCRRGGRRAGVERPLGVHAARPASIGPSRDSRAGPRSTGSRTRSFSPQVSRRPARACRRDPPRRARRGRRRPTRPRASTPSDAPPPGRSRTAPRDVARAR